MSKLWQKQYSINALLESFTVGQDYLLDRNLVRADCMGSVAHVRGLVKSELIPNDDADAIIDVLRTIARSTEKHPLEITVADEDCHTKIEEILVDTIGDAGKKVHLGRSRNDQISTVLRLWAKDMLLRIRRETIDLVARLGSFAHEHKAVPMPGRTHMQVAMPSTLGLWAAGFAETLADDYRLLMAAWEINDQSPLGSAAGYGVPLPIDRAYCAQQMGFDRVQNNVVGVSISRGKTESAVLDALDQICLTTSKLAQELIVFSLPEFGYFSLPDELTTGSSIMPQKKNPDGLELLRSRSASVSGWAVQVKNIVRSLPVGYNRDFQDTKEPFLRACRTALECVGIGELSIEKLVVHPENLLKGFRPEIYATDDAIALVERGMSFRDAYREVGYNLDKVETRDPSGLLERRKSQGCAGNLGLDELQIRIEAFEREYDSNLKRHLEAVSGCLGSELRLS